MIINLKEGEAICPECNGIGGGFSKKFEKLWLNCGKCGGDGKLDWVEMILGKKPIEFLYTPDGLRKEMASKLRMEMEMINARNKKM